MGNFQASYTYDAWGKVLSVKDKNGNEITDPNHIANVNPIRYRGYYYDVETGLFYVGSRYYDPVTGRFVNGDSQLNTDSLLGYNMFAYCENNPVNFSDPSGREPVLSYGSYGDDVRDLQAFLNSLGYVGSNGKSLVVDGIFGANTRYAVKSFQRQGGLKVDGIAGPKTNIVLRQKGFTPRKDPKKGADNRQPSGERERNIGHPDGEEHSIKPKGNKPTREESISIYQEPSSWWSDVRDWFSSLFRSCSGGVNEFGIPNTCFTGDTFIKTDNGLVPIIDIKVGDMVYSYEPELGKASYKRVNKLFSNTSNQIIHIIIDEEVIKTTPEHPFYVDGIGWMKAENVKIGDRARLSSGEIAIVDDVKKFELAEPIPVYNFEVEDYHTYFVSELEVLVHNRCS